MAEISRVATAEQPREWYSLEQAAHLCHRTTKTVRNLIYAHDVPRRLLWDVRNGVRRRVIFLSPAAVRQLQRLTVEAAD